MKLIKTKKSELAVYTQGAEDAPKVALVLPGRLDTKDYAHMRSHGLHFRRRPLHSP